MKKIMTILAALAVALMLVGCADVGGTGSATGLKTNKTVNVDATAANTQKPLNKNYRRYIKQLGDSEKVAGITTTITFKESDCTFVGDDITVNGVTAPGKAVIGYVFDFYKTPGSTDTNTQKLRDFYVFGFNPTTSQAYVEHYNSVDFKDELDVNEGTVGDPDEAVFGNYGWASVTEGTDYTKINGEYTLVVKIEPASGGKYKVYLNNKLLGTTAARPNLDTEGRAIGGVAAYVNCPKGTKVKANYKTEQSSVTGKFFVDEEEYVEEF